MSTDLNRRKWLKNASAVLTVLPLVLISRQAAAKTNATLRAQLKYQNTPQQEMRCLACLEFIPGKTDTDLGGCKVLPDDDEISPNGYCTRWNTM